MRAKEILTENTLDAAKIADIAQHMLNRYRGLRYTARERAVDHAFGYDRNQPQHQYWLAVADEISRLEKNDKGVAEDTVDEMALASYKTLGDFSKPGSFRGVDKRLVPHPKSELKAAKFFEQTPYDFRLFFANKRGIDIYGEYGPMSPEEIVKVFGEEDAKKILDNHDDAITVVFVSNSGAEKVMMTPWIMAHRFGHAIQAGAGQNRTWNAWTEVERHFFSQINQILVNDYGKQAGAATRRVNTDDAFRRALSTEYNALFNAIGTQRSSRERQINRPYEFMYEMFAQYLKTGTVTLNPLPDRIPYGKMVFGRPSQYLTLKPEVRNDPNTKYITDTLGNDIAILFGDVLSNAVGKIYVM